MQDTNNISYTQEIFRKSIHLCSLSIPILYCFMDRTAALWILIPLTLWTLTIDIARHFVPLVRELIARYFGRMMRTHELDSNRLLLSGATYVLLSATLCVAVYPKIIAVTAFAIMIVSDICSALYGRRFGKHKFLDKSREGTMAFVVSALCVVGGIGFVFHAPLEYFILGGVGAIIGGIVEAASIRLKMDDNLSIPLSIGIVMWAGAFLLLQTPQYYVFVGTIP
jgi:dolichol kinase